MAVQLVPPMRVMRLPIESIFRILGRPADLSGVVVTDSFPDHLQFLDATSSPVAAADYSVGTPDTVVWSVGAVAAGASASLDIDMEILAGAAAQVLTNEAAVTAVDAPAVAGDSASIGLNVAALGVLGADLDILSINEEDLGDVGGGVFKTRFTITIRNNGPGAAEGAAVTFAYRHPAESPEAVANGDAIGDLFVCEDRPSDEFHCALPTSVSFAANATAVMVIDFTRTGNISGPDISLSATTSDPDPSNNDWTDPMQERGRSPSNDCIIFEEDPFSGCCFIARAAYGSYLEPEVELLRNFRDDHLLDNAPGRAFVEWYYDTSPALANVIAEDEGLRLVTRAVLSPLVYGIKYPVLTGVFVLGLIGWIYSRRRRRFVL